MSKRVPHGSLLYGSMNTLFTSLAVTLVACSGIGDKHPTDASPLTTYEARAMAACVAMADKADAGIQCADGASLGPSVCADTEPVLCWVYAGPQSGWVMQSTDAEPYWVGVGTWD